MNLLRFPVALVVALFWIGYASLLCIIYVVPGIIVNFLGGGRWFARIIDETCNFYWGQLVSALEGFGGISFRFTGDKVPLRENALVIANHNCYLDWLLLFSLAKRKGRLGCCKFFAKDMVKYIPGMGWGLVLADSIFLKRDWLRDQSTIERTFSRLKHHDLPFWIISFPEGTRLTPDKLAASQAFSKKAGIPVLNNVLIPRYKGFIASLNALRDGYIDAVYDVTMGFPNRNVPYILDVAGGLVKLTVHMHVRRYTLADIPKDPKEIEAWCLKLYQDKDAMLEEFFKTGKFPGPELDEPHVHAPQMISEFVKQREAQRKEKKAK